MNDEEEDDLQRIEDTVIAQPPEFPSKEDN